MVGLPDIWTYGLLDLWTFGQPAFASVEPMRYSMCSLQLVIASLLSGTAWGAVTPHEFW